MFILNLVCCIFTAYFLGAVIFETYIDLSGEEYPNKSVYARKFLSKFWANFVYRLP